MSRPQDSIIDDDEESCPLCIEEFDLTDKNFKPCPCGYQICQFCFNSLKNTYEKSTCPNCRRVYDEKTIQFKIPSKEDIVNDKENKARKQAATKRKEVEKREVETSNRRNLAGVRVKQQNLVYVIGLVPSVKDESTLLQTLRGPQYFGQYGEIDKIVVSKSKPGATSQGIGVYITYAAKEAAALCIEVVDGSMNGDRVLRAQYGTTKYCSAYLRSENCNNKSCTFLHENGEEGHGTTLQNEPSHPKTASRPAYTPQTSQAPATIRPVQAAVQPASTLSQPMQRENSKDETTDGSHGVDTSALPSTASWANKDTPAQSTRTRRPSQAGGRSSTSPQLANVAPSSRNADQPFVQQSTGLAQAPELSGPSTVSRPETSVENQSFRPSSSGRTSPLNAAPTSLFENLVTNVKSPGFRFSFDAKAFTEDELAAIERCPSMIDPYGGAKRRLMREKEAERMRQQLDAQAKLQGRPGSAGITAEEENVESGSLALGGEPEEGTRNFSAGSAIQRPNQSSNASSSLNDQFSALGINSRSLTPQQRQQLALLNSANVQQAPGLGQPNQQGFGLGGFDDQRQNSLQNQQYDPSHGHARQSSRYSFANDSVKPNPAPRFPTQQQPGPSPQHFYPSGVQGPPPGLKTAGTPPISGGGMFAQGHGFTSNMNAGFGAAKDANAEMLLRGRSGTGSGHDLSKREYQLSLPNNSYRSLPSSAPAPGLLNSLYGPYSGIYQDPGLVKQKKKGKKHRHANTSSSGGGVVDLVDPSVLQARLHQNTGGSGQGQFGGPHQDDLDFPPLGPPTKAREILPTLKSLTDPVHDFLDSPVRPSTPRIPPGLSLPHAHPSPSFATDIGARRIESKAAVTIPDPVTPALPLLPIGHRSTTPRGKVKEATSPKPEEDTQTVSIPKSSNDATTTEGKAGVAVDIVVKTTDVSPGLTAQSVPKAASGAASPSKFGASGDIINRSSSDVGSAPTPGRLDISAVRAQAIKSGMSPLKTTPQVLPQSIVATPTSIESVPSTPNATTAKFADWTSASRPRTLRLTTTTTSKVEAAPVSAMTERSSILSAAVLKQASRQPSLSSMSRSHPSTPTISEHGASTGMSRPCSPPGSDIVGSAHEKNKSKSQAKKERKAKSRTTIESRDEDSVLSTPPIISEEVGPIISRQKKKKRTQESNSQVDGEAKSGSPIESAPAPTPKIEKSAKASSGKSTKETSSFSSQDHPVAEVRKASLKTKSGKSKSDRRSIPTASTEKEDQPPSETTPRTPYTLNDLFNDAANLPDTENALSELMNASISAASRLLRDLLESNDINLNSALFNAPPLTSYKLPPQSHRGADYLDANGYTMTSPFGELYLSGHDRKQLLQGRDVRLSDPNKPQNLLKRTMITPAGAILRHLSTEEEERVIELEDRMRENEDRHGITGKSEMKPLDDMDFMNLTGGLQELLAFPPLHRVSLLTAEPGAEGDDDDDDDANLGANGSDETEEEMASLANGFGAAPEGPMRKPMTPNTSKRKAETPMAVNLRNLDVDKLQKRIRETQAEMEGARKEMEALEKKAARKAKDVARWREALLKEVGRGL